MEPPLLPPPEDEAEFITTDTALRALCRHVRTCGLVALDTEANSMHAYREQTCVVQITAGGRSAILDALELENLTALREALDRDDVEIVMHGGDYDISVLTRDHDFRFHRVFDTMIAATMLAEDTVGLADLVRRNYGHVLEKRFQRADWGRRPLTDEHLIYLRRDTIYLPGLHAHYVALLEEADLSEEAAIEFRRLAERRGKPHAVDPEGWRKTKGSGGLNDRSRSILRAMWRWRESEAQRRNLPPFKVLAPQAMLAAAKAAPVEARHPRDIPGLGERDRRRHGRALLDAIRAGGREAAAGAAPPAHLRSKLTPTQKRQRTVEKRREDALRLWRKGEAEKRQVPNVVVLPNPALQWLGRTSLRTLDDLKRCSDIGDKRAARYGTTLLELLREL